jgi:hypothetical protein
MNQNLTGVIKLSEPILKPNCKLANEAIKQLITKRLVHFY